MCQNGLKTIVKQYCTCLSVSALKHCKCIHVCMKSQDLNHIFALDEHHFRVENLHYNV